MSALNPRVNYSADKDLSVERRRPNRLLHAFLVIMIGLGCVIQPGYGQSPYKTENVVIAIMDGTHYDRTFGDPSHELIPHLWNDLAPQGTYYTNFYNNSVTITMAGHSNIMTGVWQYNRNRGAIQTRPTVIHYMADELGLDPKEAWVIFGKGFYAYHPDTTFPTYAGSYEPGFAIGLGESKYQHDYDVLEKTIEAMATDKPRLMFVNFGVTDHTAHSGNWEDHIGAVKNNDTVLYELWAQIQSDPHYRNKTTLIITSDHGYMDPGVHDGFAEHGDSSKGARQIMLLMLGPDVKKGHVVNDPAYHIDIAPTVGELLGFQTPLSDGEVLEGALANFQDQNRKEARTERSRQAMALEARADRNLLSETANGVLQKYGSDGRTLRPSVDSTFLLWGMLAAYDRTNDARYLDFVKRWRSEWRRADFLYRGFLDAMLAYRVDGQERRDRIASASEAADRLLRTYERSNKSITAGDKRFLLSLIQASAASEIGRQEPLWHRAEKLYVDHVRAIDYEYARARVRTLGGETGRKLSDKNRELVDQDGKVLPDTSYRTADTNDPWYLLASAYIRGYGLPYKGENLADLPFFQEEVLYRTALMLESLEFPGDLWSDPLLSATAVAGIREARRRETYRGAVYESVDNLNEFDLGELRPESAELMPRAQMVKDNIKNKLTQMNYNVKYGYPRYEDFDFMVDLLRLYSDHFESDLATGVFLLALDENRRITTGPFVASPR